MESGSAIKCTNRDVSSFFWTRAGARRRFGERDPGLLESMLNLFLNPKNPRTAEYIEGRYG